MYMNENSQPGFGKISVHGSGVGAPTPELIERRAREIALIDERDPDDFTDADRDQARRELMGIRQSAAPEEMASCAYNLVFRNVRAQEICQRIRPGDSGIRVSV